jgi:hypothetical protein
MAFSALSALATDPIRKIAKANEAKELAAKAFSVADYATAITQYNFLIDSLGYDDNALVLNRAHAYFQSKDTLKAFDNYRAASMSDQGRIQAEAFNQLGVLSEQKAQQKEALSYYKEALRADATNQEARYNYELLKKKLREQEKQKQEQQDKGEKNQEEQQDKEKQEQEKGDKSEGDSEDKSKGDQDKADPSEGEKGDKQEQKDKQEGEQEGEQKEGEQDGEQSEAEAKAQQEQEAKDGDKSKMKPSTSDKLKAMNVSEEKAKQILEALRNKEAQYLQQTRKKATKKKDSGKPDW